MRLSAIAALAVATGLSVGLYQGTKHREKAGAHVYRVTVIDSSGISTQEVRGARLDVCSEQCTYVEDRDGKRVAAACGSHSIAEVRR